MKMKCHALKMFCSLVSLLIAFGASQAQASQPLIRVHAESMPLTDILNHISDALQADIYVVSPAETEITGVHFQDVPALQVLQAVLHGRSYAIVYHSDIGDEPIHFLGKAGDAPSEPLSGIADQNPGEVTGSADSQPKVLDREKLANREEKLRNQIQEIEDQIASGYADEWYEHWVSIKGPEYVIHPRERLNNYLKELANLY